LITFNKNLIPFIKKKIYIYRLQRSHYRNVSIDPKGSAEHTLETTDLEDTANLEKPYNKIVSRSMTGQMLDSQRKYYGSKYYSTKIHSVAQLRNTILFQQLQTWFTFTSILQEKTLVSTSNITVTYLKQTVCFTSEKPEFSTTLR